MFPLLQDTRKDMVDLCYQTKDHDHALIVIYLVQDNGGDEHHVLLRLLDHLCHKSVCVIYKCFLIFLYLRAFFFDQHYARLYLLVILLQTFHEYLLNEAHLFEVETRDRVDLVCSQKLYGVGLPVERLLKS